MTWKGGIEWLQKNKRTKKKIDLSEQIFITSFFLSHNDEESSSCVPAYQSWSVESRTRIRWQNNFMWGMNIPPFSLLLLPSFTSEFQNLDWRYNKWSSKTGKNLIFLESFCFFLVKCDFRNWNVIHKATKRNDAEIRRPTTKPNLTLKSFSKAAVESFFHWYY